ncbi:MAG: hypothetical protein M1832_001434 [Thelocarpon impressellum]|nr:MAG: hypothetical protein M1832_001434 [Thelocarpon impressellum]
MARTVTTAIAALAMVLNVAAAVLLQSLPDDPYHLATAFGLYSQFGGAVSAIGLEHALLVGVFANYVLLDAAVCSAPRLLVLRFFSGFRERVCEAPWAATEHRTDPSGTVLFAELGWSQTKCLRIWWGLQAVLYTGLVAATLLHLLLALHVRAYANCLHAREQAPGDEAEEAGEKTSSQRGRSMG